MIIFFNKQTGDIVGCINGRIHDEQQLKMYVGDPQDTGRIICPWKQKEDSQDYEPDSEQKDLYTELDKKPETLYDYRVDTETNLLHKK